VLLGLCFAVRFAPERAQVPFLWILGPVLLVMVLRPWFLFFYYRGERS
jgi:hypothetical protein